MAHWRGWAQDQGKLFAAAAEASRLSAAGYISPAIPRARRWRGSEAYTSLCLSEATVTKILTL